MPLSETLDEQCPCSAREQLKESNLPKRPMMVVVWLNPLPAVSTLKKVKTMLLRANDFGQRRGTRSAKLRVSYGWDNTVISSIGITNSAQIIKNACTIVVVDTAHPLSTPIFSVYRHTACK